MVLRLIASSSQRTPLAATNNWYFHCSRRYRRRYTIHIHPQTCAGRSLNHEPYSITVQRKSLTSTTIIKQYPTFARMPAWILFFLKSSRASAAGPLFHSKTRSFAPVFFMLLFEGRHAFRYHEGSEQNTNKQKARQSHATPCSVTPLSLKVVPVVKATTILVTAVSQHETAPEREEFLRGNHPVQHTFYASGST